MCWPSSLSSAISGIWRRCGSPQQPLLCRWRIGLRGFDIRSATPYGYVPTRVNVQLTNPDGSCVPRDPSNPELNQCIQVPIPVYGIVSIGGDTSFLPT